MGRQAEDLWTPIYLGERIATVRRRRGLSQKELAAKIRSFGVGVSDSMVTRFEQYGSENPNARKPQFAHLWVIAHILDVDVRRDLGATEDEYPELALIRRGLATPSLLAGKRSDGTDGRGFELTYRRRRKADAPAGQGLLPLTLIHDAPTQSSSSTAAHPDRARPA
jgi:transcriptional regulator with XRE-family HTH domain